LDSAVFSEKILRFQGFSSRNDFAAIQILFIRKIGDRRTDRQINRQTDVRDHPIRPFWSKTCLTAPWDQKAYRHYDIVLLRGTSKNISASMCSYLEAPKLLSISFIWTMKPFSDFKIGCLEMSWILKKYFCFNVLLLDALKLLSVPFFIDNNNCFYLNLFT